MKIALSVYWNNEIVTMNREDIAEIRCVSKEEDAAWKHDNPKAHTAITLKKGAKTSHGVGTAYVSEIPEDIMGNPSLVVQ